ncbi:cytochrome b/b6 domain-containing protein [Jannaschia sp. Os4]|uniref:cytochrome b/b6 domain-containing protein n=1 Tax=Jannaschia sp. Os4 TaxID=2807617 RepID=UPI00193ACF9A|nr:cytochrome b/b6 domain-containing protein [Jannaschia sp. Os4]MBM2577743.1 cytochrome b/b6 domain-containing protein [Jannaschia sp. Os4]
MSTRVTTATNTDRAYGWVERALHWAIALLMLTVIPLGVIAHDGAAAIEAGAASPEQVARTVTLFSVHKTVGIAIFALAVVRVLWALAQPRPQPIQGGWEATLAAIVHWLLYGSLILVPLLGWTHHAATEGYAPILWPLGDELPFVPNDAWLADLLGTLHTTAAKVLAVALLLHVAGALKHAVIDRDGTLARMVSGRVPAHVERPHGKALPALAAAAVWAAALGVGLWLAPPPAPAVAAGAASVGAASNWTVEEGSVSITVTQLGSPVTGSFADWQAAIDFDPAPRADGTVGSVEVSVGTGSLALGTVSQQATGEAFLASAAFPTATYVADLRPEGDGYVAEGTFALRGVEVPLTLPFTLEIDGDRAVMGGATAVDRRDFGMGETYPDESSVGFSVAIDVALTAVRAE